MRCIAIVNSQVDAGAALLRFDQAGESAATEAVPRVQFRAAPRSDDADPRAEALAQRSANSRADHRLRREWRARTRPAGRVRRPSRPPAASTTRNSSRPNSDCWTPSPTSASFRAIARRWTKRSSDERVHSPREYFHSFLHSLDAEVEGLPEAFRTKIARALRNYDVTSLEPGPELEEAVYRLFLALQRMENQVPVISRDCSAAGSAPTTCPPRRPVRWARYWTG